MNRNIKKHSICSAVTAFCISFGTAMPFAGLTASAEEILNLKIEGNPVLYDTLTAQFDYDGNKEELSYTWLVSDSENGSYTEIEDTCIDEADKLRLLQNTDWGNKDYIVYNTSDTDAVTVSPIVAAGMSPGLQGKYVKVSVSDPDGNSYESDPVCIKESWGAGSNEVRSGTLIDNARDTTDTRYVFTVGDQEFILLDVFDNDDSGRYLVMAKDTYGTREYYMTDQSQRPFEMAYWLNNTFKNSGNDGKKLPDEIISHIDYDRYWRVEQGSWWHVEGTFGSGDGKTYRYVSAQGGIMLPAYNELVQYKDIVGLHDENVNWYLRTPCAKTAAGTQADGNWMMHIESSGNAVTGGHGREEQYIRPIFCLDKEFFEDVIIPLEDMGSAVRKTLFEIYSPEELISFGYPAEDIAECTAGEIRDISIDGSAKVGGTLTASFVNDGASEKYISYQWKISDDENGEYKDISNAVTESLLIDMDMAEKWVKFTISYGDGKYVESEPVRTEALWDETFEGTVESISLKGVYETFQNIRVEYILDDITTEEDIVYKKWLISSSRDTGYEEVVGADPECLKTDTSYGGKYIKYEITLKNRRVFASEPKMIGNAWNYKSAELTVAGGSNPLPVINKATPAEYTFTIGEGEDAQEFIMLDHFDSDSSAFLIMAKNLYGVRSFYSTDGAQSFDELIGWLNNDFYAAGNGGKELPDVIKPYIDMDQGWKSEVRRYNESMERGYYGGIAIPAVTEIIKYSERIGLQDDGADWWTRTPTSEAFADGNYMQYVCGDEANLGATGGRHGTSGSAGIRPIFYISKDYFLDYKLDPETTGAEVYHELREKYTKDELRALYDNKTLEEVFGYERDYVINMYDIAGIENTDDIILATVTNQIETRDAVAVLYVFDAENKLVASDAQKVTLETGVPAEMIFEFTNMPAGEGKHVSLHLLDSGSGKLIPITYAKTEFDEQ